MATTGRRPLPGLAFRLAVSLELYQPAVLRVHSSNIVSKYKEILLLKKHKVHFVPRQHFQAKRTETRCSDHYREFRNTLGSFPVGVTVLQTIRNSLRVLIWTKNKLPLETFQLSQRKTFSRTVRVSLGFCVLLELQKVCETLFTHRETSKCVSKLTAVVRTPCFRSYCPEMLSGNEMHFMLF